MPALMAAKATSESVKADKTLLVRCRLFAENSSVVEIFDVAEASSGMTKSSLTGDGAISSASDACDLTTTLLRTLRPSGSYSEID